MSGDIRALTSLTSMPLVREKRHYPGEQQQQQHQKRHDKESPEQQDELNDTIKIDSLDVAELDADNTSESDDEENMKKKKLDNDGKNVRVLHIDEYA